MQLRVFTESLANPVSEQQTRYEITSRSWDHLA